MAESSPEVRPPKQRRSRESYERVLAAGRLLLEENGFEGVTVQEVASRSGVSVGAIYERFGNKESLLRAVHAELMEVMVRDGERNAANAPEPASATEAIASAVAQVGFAMNLHRKVLRAFMHLGAVDEVISARGSEASTALSKGFKRTLAPYRGQFTHANPRIAVDVAYRLTYSTLARQVMYGPVFESDARLAWGRLVDELSTACAAYLLCRPPA